MSKTKTTKIEMTEKDCEQMKQDIKNLRVVMLGTSQQVKVLYNWD